MNFALILDTCTIDSYYIKNKKAYRFKDDKPYTFWHSLSPECFTATWYAPFLFDEGYFLNLSELESLPDLNLDFIFYACEKCGLDDKTKDKFDVQIIRDKYPNAKLFGWIKEIWMDLQNGCPILPYNFEMERHRNRFKFLNKCDGVVTTAVGDLRSHEVYKYMQNFLNKEINFVTLPINVDYFFDNFYTSEKENTIFAYLPQSIHRRVNTYEFAKYIGNKYNMEVVTKPSQYNNDFTNDKTLPQKDFVNLWSKSIFHFNLDPMDCQPGQQALQVANVGSINIGGMNETHSVLFPETATTDLKILEEKIDSYVKDDNEKFRVIEYAWNKLNELYHPNVFKKQVYELYKKN